MVIEGMVNACDISGKKYGTYVKGGHALARGATGRVCCVLYLGPDYIKENNVTITSYEDAEKWAESEPGGYLDV